VSSKPSIAAVLVDLESLSPLGLLKRIGSPAFRPDSGREGLAAVANSRPTAALALARSPSMCLKDRVFPAVKHKCKRVDSYSSPPAAGCGRLYSGRIDIEAPACLHFLSLKI
jgi:hypothetical protein